MYAGRVVERAATEDLVTQPRHPYTAGLLRSVPSYQPSGVTTTEIVKGRLQEIPGMVPSLHELPRGCKFQERCPGVQDRCRAEEPELVRLGKTEVRCHFPVEAVRGDV